MMCGFRERFKWKINNGYRRISICHRSLSIRQFGHSPGPSELRPAESDLQRRGRFLDFNVRRGDFNGDDGRRFDSDWSPKAFRSRNAKRDTPFGGEEGRTSHINPLNVHDKIVGNDVYLPWHERNLEILFFYNKYLVAVVCMTRILGA